MRDGWTETTLDDLVLSGVVLLGRGNVISKKDMEADPGPYPVYSSAQNNDGRIGSYNKFMFDEELITWSVDGGGHVFYRPHHKFSVTNIGGYLRILDNSKFLYPFLAAVLQKLHGQHIFDWQNKAHPSVIRKLYNNIPLAPLAEQKRIVDLVSSVDAYIDALQQQADSARSARNAVLHELLYAGGDDWTETTVSTLLSRSIGGVWGTEPGTDQEEVTVVRSTEFTKSGILNFATGVPRSIKSSQLSSRALTEGDILLEKSGGGPEQPVGRVVYVQSEIPPRFVCSNFIQLLTPIHQKVSPKFLFLVMWLWHFENKTLEYQAQTTGIRNLRTPDYLEQFIALPPLGEQKRIVEIVSSMDDVIQSTEQAVTDVKNLRSGLLSDLLSGEHEIPASYDSHLGAA